MKNCLWMLVLMLSVTVGCAGTFTSLPSAYPQSVRYQPEYGMDEGIDYVYDYLAPYGNWLNLEPYGYVWTPRHTGYRWRPYSDGRWISTDDGWTWIANEEWGSIPFHYGRWGYDDDFGWFWVPGTEWSPAWVSWRWSERYMGWAPLPPEVDFREGMDYASLSFEIPSRFWVFLQLPRFLEHDLNRYALPYERNLTIISITYVHNNIHYRDRRVINEGIGIDALRRVIRRDVPRYTIRDVQVHRAPAFSGSDVHFFRPAFRAQTARKPRVLINKEQVQRDLTAAKVFEPRQQPALSVQRSAVRKRQAAEKNLLKETQAQDLRDLQRKYSDQMVQMPNAVKKTKIRKELQSQKSKLQKQHKVEKQALVERHKQDGEQVKRVVRRVK